MQHLPGSIAAGQVIDADERQSGGNAGQNGRACRPPAAEQ
jgi:hypothetical protein